MFLQSKLFKKSSAHPSVSSLIYVKPKQTREEQDK